MAFFSAILKKEYNKNTESNFLHPLLHPLACAMARFVAFNTKEVSVCQFFFQLLKIQLYFVHLFCCFHPRDRSFYSQLERAVEPRKIFIMPGHYKKIMPAQQPIRGRVLLQPYNNMYLLTEWEGRTGKYLARGRFTLH